MDPGMAPLRNAPTPTTVEGPGLGFADVMSEEAGTEDRVCLELLGIMRCPVGEAT